MIEADFHAKFQVEQLMRTLRRRTWRWFAVRMRALGSDPDSGWSHVLFPADPKTGERQRRHVATVLDDPAAVDAFFARQGRS